LRRFYGVRTVPTAPTIYSLMKNFEQFGSGDLSYSLKNKLLGQFLCHKIFRMLIMPIIERLFSRNKVIILVLSAVVYLSIIKSLKFYLCNKKIKIKKYS